MVRIFSSPCIGARRNALSRDVRGHLVRLDGSAVSAGDRAESARTTKGVK